MVRLLAMRSKAERVLSEALTLPEASRARLAGRLLDSLDADEAEAGVGEAWAAEVDSRVKELESGTARTFAWAEVRRDLLRSRRETKHTPVSRRRSR